MRRSVRLADVKDAQAAVEPRDSRQLADQRAAEILVGGVGAEAYAAVAVVSAWISFAELRWDEQRREPHGTLVGVVLHPGAGRHGHRVFDGHIDDKAHVRRVGAAAIGGIGGCFRSHQYDVARLEVAEFLEAGRLQSEDRHRGVTALIGRPNRS